MANVESYEEDSYRSNYTTYDSYKPPTPSLEPQQQHMSSFTQVGRVYILRIATDALPCKVTAYPTLFSLTKSAHLILFTQPPFTAFGSTATGTKPLPFNLPDTMNMTTSDQQLEERRRAAIREREREAQVFGACASARAPALWFIAALPVASYICCCPASTAHMHLMSDGCQCPTDLSQ